MDFHCRCTCHTMKTTTILPFFKWRTNGTTKTVPRTQNPKLYDIVRIRSSPSYFNNTEKRNISTGFEGEENGEACPFPSPLKSSVKNCTTKMADAVDNSSSRRISS